MPLKQLLFSKVFAINHSNGRQRLLVELARDRPSQAV
jgi:hypothetical protein